MDKDNHFIESAKRVLNIELDAVKELEHRFDHTFVKACSLIQGCDGKVVVTGMGKSGHIANKIAATLASTGTPAFFMHPGEAGHGDLGMLHSGDLLLAISNSGETSEVLNLLPVVKRLGIAIIGMSKNANSSLGKYSDVHLDIHVNKEACSLGLAPTSSTTATLVMGDALAVALLDANGFTADDFALSHPSGSLGRKLLLKVHDVMHRNEQLPIVNQNQSIRDALLTVTEKGLGMTAIVDESGMLTGIFTDGDLRRVIDAKVDIFSTPISKVMTANCITVKADILAAEALKLMESKNINGLIAVDDNNKPLGAFNMLDLVRSGVV